MELTVASFRKIKSRLVISAAIFFTVLSINTAGYCKYGCFLTFPQGALFIPASQMLPLITNSCLRAAV